MFQIITCFFLFFFGNAQCCALRLLILECNKWDDLLLIRMTEKTMHSRLEEVFIFGCSVMLCHLGNFLFWAARGSVAPTLRCIPGNCGLPSLEKRLKKRHILGNRMGCHTTALQFPYQSRACEEVPLSWMRYGACALPLWLCCSSVRVIRIVQ